jgi:DNA-binding transcriptional MerR regulator
MVQPKECRYTISEAGGLVGVRPHVLRQWEEKITKLRPKRDRAGRRYYDKDDIQVARTVRYLLKHQGLTLNGANKYIRLHGSAGALPQPREEALDLLRKIQEEAQAMLSRLEQ